MSDHVSLSFIRDEVAINSLSKSAASLDSLDFIETTLFVPVKFQVGGVDLLNGPRHSNARAPSAVAGGTRGFRIVDVDDLEPQRVLPIVGFASGLSRSVSGLDARGAALQDLAGGGTLRYELVDGATVKIDSTELPAVARIPLSELRQAVEAFVSSVMAWLKAELPELATRDDWEEWFPVAPAEDRGDL